MLKDNIMAKPNKMGMTSSQLANSRATRFSSNEAARSKRVKAEMDADGSNQIIDDMLAGKITKCQAIDLLKAINGR
jgi:hypothetical protein